jgi:cytoskeletal protein RodZ
MTRGDFIKKSIGTLTLGEKLSKIRNERRMSPGEVSKATKIQLKYLEYLENGTYEQLPADVYVKGFLRSYAQFFGISEITLIKLYEREKKIQHNLKKEEEKKNPIKPLNFARPIITPKFFVIGIVAVSVFLTFFYLYRELNIFISVPQLVIIEPQDGSTVADNAIQISGTTEKDAQLFINNQPVLVNQDGKFSESIGLQNGSNAITVKAVNRFDKESNKTVSINSTYVNDVLPEATENQDSDAAVSGAENENKEIVPMALAISASKTVSVSIKVDDNPISTLTMNKGDSQSFTAQNQISVSADKGNGIMISQNGNAPKLLSSQKGSVKNIIFTNTNNQINQNN